ncbi:MULTISPECIES: hypothetical protein [Micromonospora]|uniref:DUF5667 domain-containing protein n=1 Tax=Micromonospora humidisoli TaxID=2807622 RepID=A0ABS2JA29_9ACTN|nr:MULTISPECIES: hypothetical protein [Micromonospora]MBM7082991.1 hypothetical protein [Micromonospora humidisoli]
MNARLVAMWSALAVAVTGIVLVAGMASAAPVAPTTPYPSVPINPNVCKAEKIKVDQAKLLHDQAVASYNRVLQLFNRGAASAQELRDAQKAVDQAALALNNARYAEATCQNNAANPADRNCVNLTLELNRLIDELAITKDLEALAKAHFDAATRLFQSGAMSVEEYQKIKTAYDVAKLQTALIEQLIADQRARTTAAGCRNVDRPTPTPSSPAPSSPAPSGSPSTSPAPSTPAPTSTGSTPPGPLPTSVTAWPSSTVVVS